MNPEDSHFIITGDLVRVLDTPTVRARSPLIQTLIGGIFPIAVPGTTVHALRIPPGHPSTYTRVIVFTSDIEKVNTTTPHRQHLE